MTPRFWTRKEFHETLGEKRMLDKENCPFCTVTDKQESLVGSTEHWNIFYNLYPYSWDHRHLMAVPKIHKKFSHLLTPEESADLVNVHEFMQKYFVWEEYFSFTRETMGKRSVEHLHIHFLVGKLQGKFLRKMLELQGYPIVQELSFEK